GAKKNRPSPPFPSPLARGEGAPKGRMRGALSQPDHLRLRLLQARHPLTPDPSSAPIVPPARLVAVPPPRSPTRGEGALFACASVLAETLPRVPLLPWWEKVPRRGG